jgi:superfamily II DNA/RNA helicase
VVFTRTKHGAKKLAKQLNSSGVPAVELHGNLSQNARTRNLDAFHGGKATTLVATDIAARGIHVDDVGLVVHADPPVEHKAYLHRSGRTARAGAAGTVVTLMTAEQVADVRDLTRKAGIRPTTTRLDASHPLLLEVAPGHRSFPGGIVFDQGDGQAKQGGATQGQARQGRARQGQAGQGQGRQGRAKQAGQPKQGQTKQGQAQQPGRSGRARSGGGAARSGSTTAYSTSTPGSGSGERARATGGSRGSGGAAAFSTRSRAGSRGGR